MEEALLLIASLQGWIYTLLLLAALTYLRLATQSNAEVRKSLFGLERERAASRRTRALAMLGLIGLAGLATFLVSNFLVPSVPAVASPTLVPTISLLSTATEALGSGIAPQTPDSSGCSNPGATISSPSSGAQVQGLVEVRGSANIPNFAFYKIEIKASDSSANWQVVTAGNKPKLDDVLGAWDTSLVINGVYLLQLVVTDTAGNAPLPCALEVVVLPTGG
jgi:hypothetical protein